MITEIIITIILLLLIWFMVLKWYSVYQLNKLRREYNAEQNKSKPGEPRLGVENQSPIPDRSQQEPIRVQSSPVRLEQLEGHGILPDEPFELPKSDSPVDSGTDTTIKKWFRRKPKKVVGEKQDEQESPKQE